MPRHSSGNPCPECPYVGNDEVCWSECQYDRELREELTARDEEEDMPDEPPEPLGPCCICGREDATVRNILMLHQKCPTPGKGWGCIVCGLPNDGALAVLCDACLRTHGHKLDHRIQFACKGNPATDGRVAYAELAGRHEHDAAAHAVEAEAIGRLYGRP